MAMVPWLSSCMIIGLEQFICKSLISRRNHTASWVAAQSAIYSASNVESATDGCFLLTQLIAPSDSINTFPEVDRRLSESEAQSASEYPST